MEAVPKRPKQMHAAALLMHKSRELAEHVAGQFKATVFDSVPRYSARGLLKHADRLLPLVVTNVHSAEQLCLVATVARASSVGRECVPWSPAPLQIRQYLYWAVGRLWRRNLTAAGVDAIPPPPPRPSLAVLLDEPYVQLPDDPNMPFATRFEELWQRLLMPNDAWKDNESTKQYMAKQSYIIMRHYNAQPNDDADSIGSYGFTSDILGVDAAQADLEVEADTLYKAQAVRRALLEHRERLCCINDFLLDGPAWLSKPMPLQLLISDRESHVVLIIALTVHVDPTSPETLGTLEVHGVAHL
jgi:hypothetical protein